MTSQVNGDQKHMTRLLDHPVPHASAYVRTKTIIGKITEPPPETRAEKKSKL